MGIVAQDGSISTIDCHYVQPGKAAAYLIVEGDEAAFVDNNTRFAVPRLLQALVSQGLQAEQVRWIIVTHVHLDHAGGTAALQEACPNATVLAHPKTARHLIDPARLVAGSRVVYGADAFDALYGDIAPVPEEHVRIMGDDETLSWGARTLRFFNTYGHASHHFSIYDDASNSVFSGDAFGVGRSALSRPGPGFLICSSSPTDFDADEAHRSIERILATGADRVYITHFGGFDNLPQHADLMHQAIDDMEAILQDMIQSDEQESQLQAWGEARVAEALEAQLRRCKVADFEADRAWLENDVKLNTMGLIFQAQRRRPKTTT